MKQQLETRWEKWTGLTEYTHEYHLTKRRKLLFLEFLKHQPQGLKVLDLGCYVGDVVHEISQLGFAGYGVDVAEENVVKALKKYPHCTFAVADLDKDTIPFDNSHFDIIWAGDIIEHVHNTINLFSELNRVLKNDGSLVCSTPYHGVLKMIAISFVDLKRHFHPEHPHVRFYTNKSLRMILQKYGFAVVREHYLGRVPLLSNNMFFISRKKRELDWENVPRTFR